MSMTKPSLEIFVLSYNRADYLRDCLRSIQNQTFTDFTVTVLDNHSEQDIAGVVGSFQNKRIRLIVNPSNIGGVANWMQAHEMASADYMMVFHDDDCMSPRMLERQIQLFDIYPNLSHVSAGVNLVYQHSSMLDFAGTDEWQYRIFETPDDLVNAYFRGKEIFGFGSVMFRTKIAKQVQPDAERFANVFDRPYMLALTALGPCALMSRPVYNVRQHSGQDSRVPTWSCTHEIEVFRCYLEATQSGRARSLQRDVMANLSAIYSVRQSQVSLMEWIKLLREKQMFYWKHMIYLLPYFLFRNLLKRLLVRLLPDRHYQKLRSRVLGRVRWSPKSRQVVKRESRS